MDNKEVLLKILEELKIGENTFQKTLIKGQFTESCLLLAIHIIVIITLLVLFKKFNDEFSIFENLSEAFHDLKKSKPVQNYKKTEEKKEEDIYRKEIRLIHEFLSSHKLWNTIWSCVAVITEFKWIMESIYGIIKHIIIIVNCNYAPEKIIIDYLSSLF